ncbi:DUF262 domain-containing protein [Chitinophaga sp. Cy-1792]|uniref:DUF262 domain-containing protein n=1 Tax=Chitinophaga sp. Cy-1792 TaxID=2608339 RepID=UPI0014202026|nr:DUF262 domain-containing protein [Chitinophaga sp. Cy-1792]NIG55732.1 DUF262 domain-containing protein [Chitinophaga sp. Cy-1792]
MQLSEIKINEGKRLSFFQLFSTQQLNIEIPIIQRDYAQGRKSAKEVRSQFLTTLYKYLDENIPNRDLDFVYGSISRPVKGAPTFIPLDGQQRLTTLFLLHWYLGTLSGNEQTLRENLLDGNRSRFSYETRASAREFCDALLSSIVDFGPLEHGKSLSTIITNEGWYFESWRQDPTIQSMLTMLDAIDQRFRNKPDFFNRLIKSEPPLITFQFLDIGELHLTDDLYIKINSRGKELTPFENFKAKLEKEIAELFKGEPKHWSFQSGKGEMKLLTQDYFSHSIDTKWLDFFWAQSYENGKPVFSDDYIMNFIRVILTNEYACNRDSVDDNLRKLVGTQDIKSEAGYKGVAKGVSFFNYKDYGVLQAHIITALVASFDSLLKVTEIDAAHMPEDHHYNHWSVSRKAFIHDLRATDRIRFHAFLTYILRGFETSGLKEMMRVVYNLTENSDFDDSRSLANALKEIRKLSPYMPDILTHLAGGEAEISSFYGQQIEEEKIKACLILKGNPWATAVLSIEKHSFVRGQIGFLLEFSGILEYYNRNKHCNWNDEEDSTFLNIFNSYVEKSTALFDYLNNRSNASEEEYLWERAMLSKGDYLITAEYWRKNFLHSSANLRDYSWKRLLRLNGRQDNDNEVQTARRKLVKELLDDNRFDPKNFQDSCRRFIADIPMGWRAPFVRNPRLIKACTQGFIRVNDSDQRIRLLKTSKLTYHYELLTYHLFTEEMENCDFGPFKANYTVDYGETGIPKITLRGMIYSSKEYGIDIFNKDHLHLNFKVLNSNSGDTSAYDSVILDALEKADFKYPDTENGGYSRMEEVNTVMERLQMLCTHLHEIVK